MSNKQKQTKFIRLFGTFIIPLLLFVPVFISENNGDNYTGFLASADYGLPAKALYIVLLIYLIYLLRFANRLLLVIFVVTACCALAVPWIQGNGLPSSLHLAFAYGAFIAFNLIMIEKYKFERCAVMAYAAVVFTAFMLCLVAGKITGLGEAVYASGISIILANYPV